MRPFRKAAARFAVWRARRNHGASITADEVAEQTGLLPGKVQAICRKAGWKLGSDEAPTRSRRPADDYQPLDQMIRESFGR